MITGKTASHISSGSLPVKARGRWRSQKKRMFPAEDEQQKRPTRRLRPLAVLQQLSARTPRQEQHSWKLVFHFHSGGTNKEVRVVLRLELGIEKREKIIILFRAFTLKYLFRGGNFSTLFFSHFALFSVSCCSFSFSQSVFCRVAQRPGLPGENPLLNLSCAAFRLGPVVIHTL